MNKKLIKLCNYLKPSVRLGSSAPQTPRIYIYFKPLLRGEASPLKPPSFMKSISGRFLDEATGQF
jgi:hypothetical protein